MIRRLADEAVKFNLALSLHAADDTKRNKIMPINEQNNLAILIDALTYFHQKCKGKITYEYIAFDQFNDTLQDAENLVKLCQHFPVRVNIIEYNPIQGFDGKKSDPNRLDKFAGYLQKKKIRVTIRRSRGKDIDAACGQLANQD
jgi:23S rRNA (adenine2503-C2)-methyltransferase